MIHIHCWCSTTGVIERNVAIEQKLLAIAPDLGKYVLALKALSLSVLMQSSACKNINIDSNIGIKKNHWFEHWTGKVFCGECDLYLHIEGERMDTFC